MFALERIDDQMQPAFFPTFKVIHALEPPVSDFKYFSLMHEV